MIRQENEDSEERAGDGEMCEYIFGERMEEFRVVVVEEAERAAELWEKWEKKRDAITAILIVLAGPDMVFGKMTGQNDQLRIVKEKFARAIEARAIQENRMKQFATDIQDKLKDVDASNRKFSKEAGDIEKASVK